MDYWVKGRLWTGQDICSAKENLFSLLTPYSAKVLLEMEELGRHVLLDSVADNLGDSVIIITIILAR